MLFWLLFGDQIIKRQKWKQGSLVRGYFTKTQERGYGLKQEGRRAARGTADPRRTSEVKPRTPVDGLEARDGSNHG